MEQYGLPIEKITSGWVVMNMRSLLVVCRCRWMNSMSPLKNWFVRNEEKNQSHIFEMTHPIGLTEVFNAPKVE